MWTDSGSITPLHDRQQRLHSNGSLLMCVLTSMNGGVVTQRNQRRRLGFEQRLPGDEWKQLLDDGKLNTAGKDSAWSKASQQYEGNLERRLLFHFV
ncbi:unnamed protein product [Macrosiphum euphorbiae]|uniref:Uncharacterized protein n=1 Tax=Macrosiphum euphorbiae TaxID=13131 RepID=A0AAV0WIK3_9HEMI|nr:unnamed protein product [Macrosiphum euphorbiae]